MTIYMVNGFNSEPTYFDDSIQENAKQLADEFLAQEQINTLLKESTRFSICSTFVDGNNTVWREVLESDPEDIVCQVFDTFTGQYTECLNKSEALALNEQKKQNFLASIGLDVVVEMEEIPQPMKPQPISNGTQDL